MLERHGSVGWRSGRRRGGDRRRDRDGPCQLLLGRRGRRGGHAGGTAKGCGADALAQRDAQGMETLALDGQQLHGGVRDVAADELEAHEALVAHVGEVAHAVVRDRATGEAQRMNVLATTSDHRHATVGEVGAAREIEANERDWQLRERNIGQQRTLTELEACERRTTTADLEHRIVGDARTAGGVERLQARAARGHVAHGSALESTAALDVEMLELRTKVGNLLDALGRYVDAAGERQPTQRRAVTRNGHARGVVELLAGREIEARDARGREQLGDDEIAHATARDDVAYQEVQQLVGDRDCDARRRYRVDVVRKVQHTEAHERRSRVGVGTRAHAIVVAWHRHGHHPRLGELGAVRRQRRQRHGWQQRR